MKHFVALIKAIESNTKTTAKLSALQQYFYAAPNADKVWVVALFTGKKPKRSINSAMLRDWCLEITGLPPWLFQESYDATGDLAETIALLLPQSHEEDIGSLSSIVQQLAALAGGEEEEKKAFVVKHWMMMDAFSRFVFNKLLTGNFRIGVSQKTIVNALANATQKPGAVIAHRIIGKWDPATTSFDNLVGEDATLLDASKPYPFYLAYALETLPEMLGDPDEWQAEWKWDGIRGQMIKRDNQFFVWSRGEELMTDKIPEYLTIQNGLPNGTVLDGEIISADEDGMPLPFALLQTRIGRKNLTKKVLQEAPLAFFAYDVLEYDYEDYRIQPLAKRREILEHIVQEINLPTLRVSPVIAYNTWIELAELRSQSRSMMSEGIMLKKRSSTYQAGRKKGDWWKWKVDPLVIDAVMIYAQKGHGRRSNLYTDYTFAVKDGEKLVSFTKAYSGLTDKEIAQVDAFVKRNAVEKFGPVRTVKPILVFEIAFEGIAVSNRHKSGVALRFPRIKRWRKDKKPEDINTLDDLKSMLQTYGTSSTQKP